MDRLSRVLATGGMGLLMATVFAGSGCRSMRSEVPPGKPYSTTGGPAPTVGFNSDPHPATGAGAGLYSSGMTPGATGPDGTQSMNASGPGQFGTPAPNTGNFGAPTPNLYGKPGTAGSTNP